MDDHKLTLASSDFFIVDYLNRSHVTAPLRSDYRSLTYWQSRQNYTHLRPLNTVKLHRGSRLAAVFFQLTKTNIVVNEKEKRLVTVKL